MPLSELLRLATGKLESGGEDDLVELVWENGQIMMQNHTTNTNNVAPLLRHYGPEALWEMSGVSDNNHSTFVDKDKRHENGLKDHVLCSWPSQNFSHFTRAQLSTCDRIRTSVSSACGGSPVKDILINQSKNMSKDTDFHDEQRAVEPAVASSSACSGNGADRVSCKQTHKPKRKFRHSEDSECRSTDDIEAESTGLKKQTPIRGGTASKRSRAAEVHNLSERRRRDRINKKMRALQELIPNCNKVDKASMLDEAIEYLKALQLQVQIMSMGGAGLCMPPMMIPTGMQHMLHAHAPRFSPVGLGMGMGYGMGMRDMSGGALGCPVFPMSSMQPPYFPSSVSGPLAPSTGQPPTVSSMGLSFLGNVGHKEVPSATPTLSTRGRGNSVNHKSNKLRTTNETEGLDQPAAEE